MVVCHGSTPTIVRTTVSVAVVTVVTVVTVGSLVVGMAGLVDSAGVPADRAYHPQTTGKAIKELCIKQVKGTV
jgi:hypothetical protein